MDVTEPNDGSRDTRDAASMVMENHSSAVLLVDKAMLKVWAPCAEGLKKPDHRIAKSCSTAGSGQKWA